MEFIKHPKHTLFMGKPPSWNEATQGSCGALSILDNRHMKPNPYMESCWQTDGFEGALLGMGLADLRLTIHSFVHPPVSMVVYPKTDVTRPQKREAISKALLDLAEYARSEGYSVTMQYHADTQSHSVTIGDHHA